MRPMSIPNVRSPWLRWAAGSALLLAVGISVVAFVQQARYEVRHGLRRTVEGAPRRASRIVTDLEVDPAPAGTEQVVRWRGFWWVPEPAEVELHAWTNGLVHVAIDGTGALARSRHQGRDGIPETVQLAAGLHRLQVLARLPFDGEVTVRYAAPDSPPRDLPPERLFPRRYGERRLRQIDRAQRLAALARLAWLLLAGGAGAVWAVRSRSRLARLLDRPRAAAWIHAATAASYVALLVVWFQDPGVPGTNSLRAWDARLVALPAVALLGLSLRAGAPVLRRMLGELRRALVMRPREIAGLAAVLALALAMQAPLLAWPLGVMDADSTISALAGQHIADGRLAPAFIYGSLKSGTLSSHLVALRTWLLGDSTRALIEVTRLFYLGLLVSLYLLLLRGLGAPVALASTGWLAAAPYPMVVHTTYSEFPELLALAAAATLLAVLIAERSLRERGWWAVLGGVIGLGLWSHALFASAAVAILATSFVRMGTRSLRPALLPGLTGLALGLAPAVAGLGSRAPDLVSYLLTGGPEPARPLLGSLAESVTGLFGVTLPVLLLGYRHAAEAGGVAAVYAAALLAAGLVWGLRRAHAATRGQGANDGDAAAVPIVLCAFLVAHLGIFWLSPFRGLTFPPRYLVPLYLPAIPLIVGATAACARRLIPCAAAPATLLLVAAMALPGARSSLAWYGQARQIDTALRGAVATMLEAGIDHCEGSYWDAYRVTHASLEAIVCAATDLRRVPFYGRIVRQRRAGRFAPLVYDLENPAAGEQWQRRLEREEIPYEVIETPRLRAIVAAHGAGAEQ